MEERLEKLKKDLLRVYQDRAYNKRTATPPGPIIDQIVRETGKSRETVGREIADPLQEEARRTVQEQRKKEALASDSDARKWCQDCGGYYLPHEH